MVGLVVLGVLAVFKWMNIGLVAWRTSRAEARARKTSLNAHRTAMLLVGRQTG